VADEFADVALEATELACCRLRSIAVGSCRIGVSGDWPAQTDTGLCAPPVVVGLTGESRKTSKCNSVARLFTRLFISAIFHRQCAHFRDWELCRMFT
jgi:hypothetical protein